MKRLENIRHELLDLLPIGIFWKDRQSVYLGCNKYHADHAGLSDPNEVVGKTDYEFTWREFADQYRKDDEEVMQRAELKPSYFEEINAGANKRAFVKTTKVPLFDDDGKVCGILGVWQDITEYKDVLVNLEGAFAEMAIKANALSDKLDKACGSLETGG